MDSPIIIVYDYGIDKISFPPRILGNKNLQTMNILESKQGLIAKVNGDIFDFHRKLNKLKGSEIVHVYLDTNTITTGSILIKSILSFDENNKPSIYLETSNDCKFLI